MLDCAMRPVLLQQGNKFDELMSKVINVIAVPACCGNVHSMSKFHLLLVPYDNDKATRSDESAKNRNHVLLRVTKDYAGKMACLAFSLSLVFLALRISLGQI